MVFRFCGVDGACPDATPIIDAAGVLYGTTFDGGTGACATYGGGGGLVYGLTPAGTKYTQAVLDDFQGSDGSLPTGSLYHGPNGSLYGSTPFGGAGASNDYGITGCGLVFALIKSKSGYAEKVLYDLAATKYEGIHPNDPLIDGGSIYISTCCGSHDQYGALDAIKLPSGF